MDEEITAIRIYMTTGVIDIPANGYETNRMFDEINILQDGISIARFFTRNLVGYEIIRGGNCHECSRAVEFGCMED